MNVVAPSVPSQCRSSRTSSARLVDDDDADDRDEVDSNAVDESVEVDFAAVEEHEDDRLDGLLVLSCAVLLHEEDRLDGLLVLICAVEEQDELSDDRDDGEELDALLADDGELLEVLDDSLELDDSSAYGDRAMAMLCAWPTRQTSLRTRR